MDMNAEGHIERATTQKSESFASKTQTYQTKQRMPAHECVHAKERSGVGKPIGAQVPFRAGKKTAGHRTASLSGWLPLLRAPGR